MVDIQTISIAIASASVVAGVIYYALQLRHQSHMIQQQNKMRQTDLIMRLYLTWGSEEYKKGFGPFLGLETNDYDSFVKKYGSITSPERSPVWTDVDRYTWFFNGIGYLVYYKFADVEQVDDLFGYGVITMWEKTKPLVEGWRKQLNIPKSTRWFEYLYNEMKKREQRGAKNG
jgi:hypothetical protein